MHDEAMAFVKSCVEDRFYPLVYEFGARNVNGSVRDVIFAEEYWGIDLAPGAYVDEVANAAHWRAEEKADLVVCCEVLEHAPEWGEIIKSAYENLRLGGKFIMTCATWPRAPHSAVDGGPVRPGEWYGNIDPDAFRNRTYDVGFVKREVEIHQDRGDLYALLVKATAPLV